jgi:hypothetical protein
MSERERKKILYIDLDNTMVDFGARIEAAQ